MNHLFIAFTCFICISIIHSLEVQKCDGDFSDIPKPLKFESKGCDSYPCPLIKGTTSNANITFMIPSDTDISTILIEAKTAFTGWLKFPAPDNNTCHHLLNSYCPLDKNEVVVFNLAIPVAKAYPAVALTLRLQFLDEKENAMACLLVPCKVKNSN